MPARMVAPFLLAGALYLLAAPVVAALSCEALPDQETAAIEMLRGEHPLWSEGSMLAVVESVERDQGFGLALRARPTHVFAGDYPAVVIVNATVDDPPVTGELVVQPCAPNFEVNAEQIERLVGAAPSVEVRTEASPAQDGVPWLAIGAGAATLASLAVALSMWRRSER